MISCARLQKNRQTSASSYHLPGQNSAGSWGWFLCRFPTRHIYPLFDVGFNVSTVFQYVYYESQWISRVQVQESPPPDREILAPSILYKFYPFSPAGRGWCVHRSIFYTFCYLCSLSTLATDWIP